MNFIPCRIVEVNSRLQIDTGDFQFPLFDGFTESVEATGDREFILGIRPEDISEKNPQGQSYYGGSIRAQIDFTEILGKEVFVHLSTGKNTLSALLNSGPEEKFSQDIELEINLPRVHLFRVDTGEAIF